MELSIQERLKDLRVECGLTLEQLAEQTHLSIFTEVCPQVRDILSRSPAWDEGRGLSYMPCLLMKPVLLWLHVTQS